jgi:hypothetical protein
VTARAALARLKAAGVTVVPDGADLRLRSAGPIPPDLVALAKAEKPGLLRLVSDQATDSADIAAEPPLPAPGSAARNLHDQQQRQMVRGLLLGFLAHSPGTQK